MFNSITKSTLVSSLLVLGFTSCTNDRAGNPAGEASNFSIKSVKNYNPIASKNANKKGLANSNEKSALKPVPSLCNTNNSYSGINGGVEASPGESPSTVLITTGGNCGCTGALLSTNYVLTSAHCVDGLPVSSIKVWPGAYDKSALTGITPITAVSYKMHENYGVGPGIFPNDIAIITLQSPIAYSAFVNPATLPPDNSNYFTGDIVTPFAWGNYNILQKANIGVISQGDADTRLTPISQSTSDGNIALFDSNNSIEAGSDSVYYGQLNGNTTLIGIGAASFGPSYPSVGTRVSYYLDWIMVNTP